MAFTTEEDIARLIFLYLQDKLTEAETKELSVWRAVSPEHEALFVRISSQKNLSGSIKRFVKTPEENDRNWQILQQQMHPVQRTGWKKIWSYAAIITVILTLGGIALYRFPANTHSPALAIHQDSGMTFQPVLILPDGRQINLKDANSRDILAHSAETVVLREDSLSYEKAVNPEGTEVYHTLRIPYGSEYLLTLSDNSFVHLNAGSELTYPVRFSGQQRKVYLKGEAYFKVQKNSKCPFIVSVNELEVRVTGTAFGIRAYEEEEEIRTTLESGSVSVSGKDSHADLSPGHQAIFDKQTADLHVREVNTELYLGWKNGRIIYDNCPLEDILRDLGRWYAFDVIYRKQELRSSKFSLNMQRHGSISQVLELLANADNIRFEIKGHTVLVQ